MNPKEDQRQKRKGTKDRWHKLKKKKQDDQFISKY